MRKIEFDYLTSLPGHPPYQPGDRKSFADEEAALYIQLGWAHCVETGEKNDIKPGVSKVFLDPTKAALR